ncbi:hypothetical protein [Thermococcus peptonophilus]|uniref:hypothetical protein n=1 Tax=Thermococcus peptonophilus TaxID=53952 RepID=UPI0006CFF0D5
MSRIAYREDEKENLRRIIAQIYKLDYKNLLSYWATQEVKKAEMYQLLYHLAKKINWDERIAGGLFREMYIDSVTQAEKLISVFKKQFPEERWNTPRFLPWRWSYQRSA